VMQDGTKIRALASGKSFRREREVRRHLERVREYVREVGSAEAEGENARTRAARQRAERERKERWLRAVAELHRLQASKSDAKVSLSDPEARFMKQSDGGFAPSYNVQISADAAHGAIVGLEVVQDHNDRHQLVPALERMQQQMGRQPQHMTADGEYTTRANIEALHNQLPRKIPGARRPSSTTRSRTAMFVRKASCCGRRDGRRGVGFATIATELAAATARVVRRRLPVALATTAATCCVPSPVPRSKPSARR